MSAYNVLFVSEEKIKSYTSIHESVSPEDLTPYVLQAQRIYIETKLGTTLYEKLESLIHKKKFGGRGVLVFKNKPNAIAPSISLLFYLFLIPY